MLSRLNVNQILLNHLSSLFKDSEIYNTQFSFVRISEICDISGCLRSCIPYIKTSEKWSPLNTKFRVYDVSENVPYISFIPSYM